MPLVANPFKQISLLWVMLLAVVICSAGYALTNENNEFFISQPDEKTKLLNEAQSVPYLKSLINWFDDWKTNKEINKGKRIKIVFGDFDSVKDLALIKREALKANYAFFKTQDESASQILTKSLELLETSTASSPNTPVIMHIHISKSEHLWFSDYWNVILKFKGLTHPNAFMLISTDNHSTEKDIKRGAIYAPKYEHYEELKSLINQHTLEKITTNEIEELLAVWLKGYKFDNSTSLSNLGLIGFGYSLNDLLELVTEIKKVAENKTISLKGINEALAKLDLTKQEAATITITKTETSSETTTSGKGTSRTKSSLYDFHPAGSFTTTFKDVAGQDVAKNDLKEFLAYIKEPEKFKKIGASMPKGIILYGPPGTGKTYLATAFAGEANMNFIYASGSQFLGELVGQGARNIKKIFAFARENKPCVLFIDEFDSIATTRSGGGKSEEYVNQLLVELDGVDKEANEGVIVMAATNQLHNLDPAVIRPGRFDSHVYIGIPTPEDRMALIKVFNGIYKVDKSVKDEELSKMMQGWVPAKMRAMYNKAAIHSVMSGSKTIKNESFEYAKNRILQGERDLKDKPKNVQSQFDVILPEDATTTFADVGGLTEAKEELKDILFFMKNKDALIKAGVSPPKGAILYGPPGTGKTMLARALAGEADVTFIGLSATELMGQYIGHSAPIIRELFQLARSMAPAIIFIDEFDAIVQDRSRFNAGNGVINLEIVNQLLAELDGIKDKNTQLFIVAATNDLDSIDPAILRPGRFDRHIEIPYPDKRGRIDIAKVFMKQYSVDKSVTPEEIANMTYGWSPAQMRQLFNEAAVRMVKEGKKSITISLLSDVKDRIMIGSKTIAVTDKDALELTAYHEAGHALVSYLIPESRKVVEKINMTPRGHTLGVTIYQIDEETFGMSYKEMRAEIATAFGGRAAEEIVRGYDGITTGISSDLEKATNIAHNLVTRYGYSENTGLVTYSSRSNINNSVQKDITAEVKRILDEEYARTKQLLMDNRDKLDKIVKVLMEKESIGKDEFYKIVKE